MSRRSYKKAFERRILNKVEVDDFYVEINMYKVQAKRPSYRTEYDIITTENNGFIYGSDVITKQSKSASAFNREEAFTKTELIELFSNISINDVWSAHYQTYDKTKEWSKKVG